MKVCVAGVSTAWFMHKRSTIYGKIRITHLIDRPYPNGYRLAFTQEYH